MDKIIEILKENADFKVMCFSDQHVISISGLEIHHEYKKVFVINKKSFWQLENIICSIYLPQTRDKS